MNRPTSGVPRAVPPAVNAWSAEYLDAEFARYQADPASVPPDLRAFFQGFDLGRSSPGAGAGAPAAMEPAGTPKAEALRLQHAVGNLIDSYRRRGHIAATLDPFGRERARPSVLTLDYHGLTSADLDRQVDPGSLPLPRPTTLREVVDLLERTYCGPIGAEIMHLSNDEERSWLIERVERSSGRIELSRGERVHILEQLVRTELFEQFLQKRYPGEKRFSLEGGDSLIPLLDRVIEAAAAQNVEEFVFGMAHRGRLNVLNNILGKTYEQIFTEFEDNWEEDFADGGGDVKYHRGYSGDRVLGSGRTVHLAMASNPSHLESVNPVVLGRCRAKQRLRGDRERRRVVPLLVHGDAAFIGQGIVAEVFNLSRLQGYTCGGCIHVAVNNLIGFTTGPDDARSTRYCTDIALMVEAPVFHVNGQDPEAVVAAAQIAVEYRQKFCKDVVIDMWCFRRYGHNEQDEPSFTQPVLAKLIKDTDGVLTLYARRLLSEGVISDKDVRAISERLDRALDEAQAAAKKTPFDPTIDPGSKRWVGFSHSFSFDRVPTGAPIETIREVCSALGRVPDGFRVNPKLKRLLESRAAIPETRDVNHADAELIAFGTLLLEGNAVRLSGQDSRRGTFTQRHAVLTDFETAERYIPLNSMRTIAESPDDAGAPGPDGRPTQGRFCVYDSPLSEAAVMGFDYGYSLADPKMLVLWEAQFGDFVNGAQVIIDQFLASAEAKWDRWSGLVLLLPHGYEGAGPEHSSARLERFLDLCGDDNMIVAYPTTAAQHFHLLRRQVRARFRKPLIVMTPKSMLRVATSRVEDLTSGSFEEVMDDPAFAEGRLSRGGVTRLLFCTGKIYHELASRRDEIGRHDTAIIRFEQPYPFHAELAREILSRYPAAKERLWVQEEPRNMGAYLFMADMLSRRLGLNDVGYVGRVTSPSPATGSKSQHKKEQEAILERAVGGAGSGKPLNGAGAHAGSPGEPAPRAAAARA